MQAQKEVSGTYITSFLENLSTRAPSPFADTLKYASLWHLTLGAHPARKGDAVLNMVKAPDILDSVALC